MANPSNTVIYIGVTNDLKRRVFEHQSKLTPSSFVSHYNVIKLVYFEGCNDAYSAIAREKQLKAGSRAKKVALIQSTNPDWKDLSDEL